MESISATGKSRPLRDTVPLPVLFQPKGPGHYPCQITLKSAYDIRVYQLECTVCPEGSVLELEFITPTHQPVTQDIPVVNISYILVCKRNVSCPTESTTNPVRCISRSFLTLKTNVLHSNYSYEKTRYNVLHLITTRNTYATLLSLQTVTI